MFHKINCLTLWGLVLILASCSIPDTKQESEILDDLRRYIVTVGIGQDKFTENMYLAFDANTKKAVIIDPGSKSEKMEAFIKAHNLDVLLILNTHGHFDHTSANRYYSDRYHAPSATHQADAEFFREENTINKPEKFFSTEEHFDVGFRIQIIATPGHSAGSVCYLINGRLFSGDTLFNGSIGRIWGTTEAEEKEKTDALIQIIKAKLLTLPENTLIFPGHGELTDIGHEKQYNPYLK